MIKISKGPAIEKFALCFVSGLDFDRDEAVSHVIQWISSYVNGPWSENQIRAGLEGTEAERLASMKAYIKFRLDNSITEKARRANSGTH
jgi:hypothetical protein